MKRQRKIENLQLKISNCKFPILAALVLFCLGPEVQAETLSIVASDNAYVVKGSPDADQNEAQELKVQNWGQSSGSKFTYLRFDLSPLADLVTIESASLDIYWLSSAGGCIMSVLALNDLADGGLGTSETSWSGNLTGNTRPDGTGNMPNANTSGKLASHPYDAPMGKVASFDLTSALPGLLDSDTNNQLTLILYGSAGNSDTKFASLDNTGGYAVPTLNVTGEPIPEPGTLALLGMALLGLGFYTWRRSRR